MFFENSAFFFEAFDDELGRAQLEAEFLRDELEFFLVENHPIDEFDSGLSSKRMPTS